MEPDAGELGDERRLQGPWSALFDLGEQDTRVVLVHGAAEAPVVEHQRLGELDHPTLEAPGTEVAGEVADGGGVAPGGVGRLHGAGGVRPVEERLGQLADESAAWQPAQLDATRRPVREGEFESQGDLGEGAGAHAPSARPSSASVNSRVVSMRRR